MLVEFFSHYEVTRDSYEESNLNSKEDLVDCVCPVIHPLKAEQYDHGKWEEYA